MKKIRNLFLSTVLIFCMLSQPMNVKAVTSDQPLLQRAHATAYCVSGITASGKHTRAGVCAGMKAYMGSMIVVYQRLPDGSIGNYIGTWECLDTGGTKGLNNGTVVDIWQPSLAAVQNFMNVVYEDGCQGKVYIQVIKGKG